MVLCLLYCDELFATVCVRCETVKYGPNIFIATLTELKTFCIILNTFLTYESVQVNLKEQGQLIRQDEFLVFFRKKKYYRHIFLFQDLILFSKTKKTEVGNDIYIYKQSFKVITLYSGHLYEYIYITKLLSHTKAKYKII